MPGPQIVTDSQKMRPPTITIARAVPPNSSISSHPRSAPQGTSHSSPVLANSQLQAQISNKDTTAIAPATVAATPAADNHFINEFSSFYSTTLGLPPDARSGFASEHTNSEFLVLSDFLNIIGPIHQTAEGLPDPGLLPYSALGQFPDIAEDRLSSEQQMALRASSAKYTKDASFPQSRAPSNNPSRAPSRRPSVGGPTSVAPSETSSLQEKFFLTAADPVPESAEERLKQVINAKVEAGLMKPFDYVRGYARLQKYMDINMSPDSRSRILAPLSKFRPAFRAIAKKLTDVDLILVEEAFERLLLDYDRVFTSMAVPACLWRRTGEIFRGNKEFAALLNLPVESLRDGKLAITELMAEDSAVNYWEKYGSIAFDGQQKAVLTSCLLQVPGDSKGCIVSCCFSFTIKRDRYNIPSCIVGNFIPISF